MKGIRALSLVCVVAAMAAGTVDAQGQGQEPVKVHYAWVNAEKTVALIGVRGGDGTARIGLLGRADVKERNVVTEESFQWPELTRELEASTDTLLDDFRTRSKKDLYEPIFNDSATGILNVRPEQLKQLRVLPQPLLAGQDVEKPLVGVWRTGRNSGRRLTLGLSGGLALIRRDDGPGGLSERVESAVLSVLEATLATKPLPIGDGCSDLLANAEAAAEVAILGSDGIRLRRDLAQAAIGATSDPAIDGGVLVRNKGLRPLALSIASNDAEGTDLIITRNGTSGPTRDGDVIEPCEQVRLSRSTEQFPWPALKEAPPLEANVEGDRLVVRAADEAWSGMAIAIVVVAIVGVVLYGLYRFWWRRDSVQSAQVKIRVMGSEGPPGKKGEGPRPIEPVAAPSTRGVNREPAVKAPEDPILALLAAIDTARLTIETLRRNSVDAEGMRKELEDWKREFASWSARPGQIAGAIREVVKKDESVRSTIPRLALRDSIPEPMSPTAISQPAGLISDTATRDVVAMLRRVSETLDQLESENRSLSIDTETQKRALEAFRTSLSTALQSTTSDGHGRDPEALLREVRELRTLTEKAVAGYAASQSSLGSPAVSVTGNVTDLDARYQKVRRVPLLVRGLENAPWIRRTMTVLDDIDAAGALLEQLAQSGGNRFEDLLAPADLAPAKLARALRSTAQSVRSQLLTDLADTATFIAADQALNQTNDDVIKLVADTLKGLLSGGSGSELTRMLRLWQVINAYCRESDVADARDLYTTGSEYCRQAEVVQQSFARVGIRFHPIRFMQPPPAPTSADYWPNDVQNGTAPIQNSLTLTRALREHLAIHNGLVADVSFWGRDCDLKQLNLSSKTNLFVWAL